MTSIELGLTSDKEAPRMVKIAIAGLVCAFLIFYVITSPDQAANIVKGAGHLTTSLAHGISNFLNKLGS